MALRRWRLQHVRIGAGPWQQPEPCRRRAIRRTVYKMLQMPQLQTDRLACSLRLSPESPCFAGPQVACLCRVQNG